MMHHMIYILRDTNEMKNQNSYNLSIMVLLINQGFYLMLMTKLEKEELIKNSFFFLEKNYAHVGNSLL